MKIDYAVKVDFGINEYNDDRILVNGELIDNGTSEGIADVPFVAVVCDGCGGYKGGYLAAETVLKRLSQKKAEALTDVSALTLALADCNLEVIKKKNEIPEFSEMCTTIAGCVFADNEIYIFHSGDSRVYRHDHWGISRMTKDHSLVQEMVDAGEITSDETYTHERNNVITRCIGTENEIPDIYVSHTGINQGEKYIMCSDGLWEFWKVICHY